MSLASPALTTTSYKKRKEKITKAKQTELERDWRARNVRLKEIGLPKESYEQFLEWIYGRGKKTKEKAKDKNKTSPAINSSNKKNTGIIKNISASEQVSSSPPPATRPWITGPVSSKPSPTYTGSEMIGLTIIHKSCIQPVFNKEAAIDAANMRR